MLALEWAIAVTGILMAGAFSAATLLALAWELAKWVGRLLS